MKDSNKVINKNGTIEFLRFLFCMCVLLFHAEKYVLGEPSLNQGIHFAFFPHGSLGVEFFFLLTGLLLARSVDKEAKNNNSDIGTDTVKFLSRKVGSIFPYHIIAFLIIFAFEVVTLKLGIFQSALTLLNSIPSILLLQMTGIPGTSLNHIEWYLSVMIISVAIIYPLCKKYTKTFFKVIAPMGSILILGYLGKNYGSLTGVMVWTGLVYKSLLRGLAEIMLGIFAYYVATEFSKIKLKKWHLSCLTFIEFILYAVCILIVVCTFPRKYEFIALILLFFALIITYSQNTLSTKLFNRKIFYFLGKLSLPIYLSQLSAIKLVNTYFVAYGGRNKIILIVILTFIIASITMVLGNIILKKIRTIKSNVNN